MRNTWFALCLGLGLSLIGEAAVAEGRLNVLCGANEDWCQLMADTFRKETEIQVAIVRKSSGEILAQLRAEARNPKVDVVWGGTGDPHLQAAAEGLTEQYMVDRKDLLGWAINLADISGNRTIGIYAGVLGIGYNESLLKEKKLPVPACWRDLANPAYKGEIQVANPNSSGTAYTELATLVQIFGEDPAFKLLSDIHANVNQYTKSGVAPGKAASRGETTIAIGFMHDMVAEAKAGFPIKIVSPCEGTGHEVGAVSIVKGARNLDNAKKWVDFSLRPDIQALAVQVKSYQLPSNARATVPPEAPDLALIKLIDYDFATYGSEETRKRLLARFSAITK